MADVTIRIEALDLTQTAIRSVLQGLNRLTTEAAKSQASRTVKQAFDQMTLSSQQFARMSVRDLRNLVREREQAIRTMRLMEVRFQRNIQRAAHETQRQKQRLKRQDVAVTRRLLQEETQIIRKEIRERERTERDIDRARAKRIRENKSHNARVIKEITKFHKDAQRERDRQEKAAEKRTRERLQRMRKMFHTFFSGLRNAGFNLIFAGSLFGSQASLLGSGIGGQLSQVATQLRGGFTDLNQIIPKTIRLITQTAQTLIRVLGGAVSLYVSLLGNLAGSFFALIPKIGIFFTGLVVGTTNAVTGSIRAITDGVAGMVDVVGGALEGLFVTVSTIAGGIIRSVLGVVGTIFTKISEVFGKVGEIAGQTFGKLVGGAVSAITSNFEKIAGFRAALADVFVQTPEIGADKFDLIRNTIEDISKRLPLLKKDLSKGLFEIVSTQLTSSPEEALQVLQGVANATVAGGQETDVFSVSQAATGILSAYNLEADKTNETLSKMFKTAILGRFNFKQLSDGIQAVSGIAANFDVTLNDLLSTLVLASKSLRPREVFVGVKNLVLSLAAPTFEAKRAMDKLGISLKTYTEEEKKALRTRENRIKQMELTIRGLDRLEKKDHAQRLALKDLRKALKAANEEYSEFQKASGQFIGLNAAVQQLAKLNLSPEQIRKAIPERRALAAFAAIVSAQDRASEAIQAITEETGQAVERGVQIQTEQVLNQMQLVKNNFEALFNDLFTLLEPTFIRVLKTITDRLKQVGTIFVATFGESGESVKQTVERVMLDAVGIVFGTVETIIKNWRKITEVAEEVFNVVATIGKALLTVGKLIGESIQESLGGQSIEDAVRDTWDNLTDMFKTFWKSVEQVASGDVNPIIGLIEEIEILWARMIDYMRNSLADFLQSVEGPLNGLVSQVRDYALSAANPIAAASGVAPSTAASNRRTARRSIQGSFATAARRASRILNPTGPAAQGEFGVSPFTGQGNVRGAPGDDLDRKIAKAFKDEMDRLLREMQATEGSLGLATSAISEGDVQRKFENAIKNAFIAAGREAPSGVGDIFSDSDLTAALRRIVGSNIRGSSGRPESLIQSVERNSEQFSDNTILLGRFGVKGGAAQDAFGGKSVNLSGIIESLRSSQEAEVKARIDAAREERAAEKKREQQLKAIEDAIKASGTAGASVFGASNQASPVNIGAAAGAAAGAPFIGPGFAAAGAAGNVAAGAAGAGAKAKAEAQANTATANLDKIESNTKDTVAAIKAKGAAAAPSAGAPTSGFFGAAPGVGVFTDPSDKDNIGLILKEALDQLERGSQAKEETESTGSRKELSKQDLVRARKQFRRERNQRSGLTFGGTFGIRKGPLGRTVGKPRFDKDGNITGFSPGIASPFGGPVIVRGRAEQAAKAAAAKKRLQEARDRKKKQKETFEAATAAADTAGQGVIDQGNRLELAGQGVVPVGPDGPELTGVEGIDSATNQADVNAVAQGEVKESVKKLDEAMKALTEEQNDSTDKLLDFSDEQIKALEEAGINTENLGNMVLEGTNRVSTVVEKLIKRVQEIKKQQEETLRTLEAASGEL